MDLWFNKKTKDNFLNVSFLTFIIGLLFYAGIYYNKVAALEDQVVTLNDKLEIQKMVNMKVREKINDLIILNNLKGGYINEINQERFDITEIRVDNIEHLGNFDKK